MLLMGIVQPANSEHMVSTVSTVGAVSIVSIVSVVSIVSIVDMRLINQHA